MIITNGIQAEKSILNSFLGFDGDFDVTSDLLTVDDFQAIRHQYIYQAVADLAAENKPYDLVMVSDLMAERGQIGDDKCPSGYFAQLFDMPRASPRSLRSHAELIKASSLRRRSINALKQGLYSLEDAESKTNDVNNKILSALANLEGSVDEKEIFDIDDMIDGLVERIQSANDGVKLYIDTGFPELDNLMRLKAGNLCIVAARPSQGKSLLAMNMQTHLAKYQDGVSVFFSIEMDEADLTNRMFAAEIGVPIDRLIAGQMNEDEQARFQKVITARAQMKIKIVRKTGLTVSHIRTHMNKLKREYGKIGSVCIDYLQLMDGLNGDDSVKKIGATTQALKAMGAEFECPIILLSQLNRAVESRPNKRPVLSDLRDSGSIEQDADQVLFIYRDDYYKKKDGSTELDGMAEIIVAKNRNGGTNTVRLAFEGHMGRFSNHMPYHDSFNDVPEYGKKA
ncbi:replicative DNA helicase [Psychrobacter sp. DAB_AL32B]|uniref:replicative DNA helicase n=1 Tax=Psychrobacter sp. DAB_AL32B TaxID=1028414 RepID=UPI000B7C5C07|nr:replicative DNA helicase [Psychrobacter sp. DAB_AL32B]OXL25267.1 hypothetical protein CAN34_04510 [Psychrobacter sp. DAB_AL32B]